MAYRSVDEEYAERLREMGLTSDAFVLHTELVCRGKMAGISLLAFSSLRSRLKLDTKTWNQVISCLLKKERIAIDEEHEIIWLVGFIEHQWLSKGKLSDTIKRGILNEYNALPNTSIRQSFKEKYPTLFDTPSDTPSDTPNDTSEKKSPLKLKVLKLKEEIDKGGDKTGRHKTPTPPGFQFLVDFLFETWEAKYGFKLTWTSADGQQLRALQSRQPADLIQGTWRFYLANPDNYCQKNGQSFRNFASVFDKVVSRMSGVEARDTRFDNLKETK